jgi:transcriptional regulator GlxA family with amidase domain
MARLIGFYVFPGFQLLDLGGPLAAFQLASERVPGAYRLELLSRKGRGVSSSAGVVVATRRAIARDRDTLVAVGGQGLDDRANALAEATCFRRLAVRCRRVASVCTGAFLLAAAQLLDGRRATTHWRHADRLQADYPALCVEADRIFIEDRGVWTSAGISAGIDLALALIETDLGAEIAREVACEMVGYYRRPGGQSQFSALLELEPASDRIRKVLQFAREHLHESLPVERLAGVANLSPRQFSRLFTAETGQPPAKAIERLRVEAARLRVEGGSEPLEAIALAVGFANTERLRRGFLRAFGQPPQAVRRSARPLREASPGIARRSRAPLRPLT